MQRPIKFRAYHKKERSYYYFDFWTMTRTRFPGYYNPIDGSKACELDDSALYEEPEFYICRKDKNGKELYERDIITFDDTEIGGGKCKGEIVWNDDQSLSRLEWGLWTKQGYLPTDFLGAIEVIGNIHENSELLEVK